MAISTLFRRSLNRWLNRINLRIDTLTSESREYLRLANLEQAGYFSKPVFPIPTCFKSSTPVKIFYELSKYQKRFEDFVDPAKNDTNFSFSNGYFSSPDAEVLYTFIRLFEPRIIVEIGSGNSTKIMRQAILDAHLHTRLISIDPEPRINVDKLVDEMYPQAVENFNNIELFYSLVENDILFIDSSHEIKAGNDILFLYFSVLPKLSKGVLVHIHDIFLPYEYPKEWLINLHPGINEQYLVQAILMFSDLFEVLWPGHFMQRTQQDFASYFPHMDGRLAQSLWLRKKY